MNENRIKKNEKLNEDKLFGIDTGESLQSVHFASSENQYLDQHTNEDSEEYYKE